MTSGISGRYPATPHINREKVFAVSVGLLFCYYLFRLVYFAIVVPPHTPPDEATHIGLINIFSQSLLFPENSEETHALGNVEHIPWLYYYSMGRLLKLNLLPLSDLYFLRGANILLSLATIMFACRWLSLLTENRFARFLFTVLLTNTAMFSFLGAAVSYDNMVNLCAVLSLYYLHRFCISHHIADVLLLGIFLCMGALTKISFLPLVPIFLIILLFSQRRHLAGLLDDLRHNRNVKKIHLVPAVILAALIILCLQLYGTNLWKFGKLTPAAHQVLTENELMQQRIFARNHIVWKYRSGDWSYERALAEAEKIQYPGDRKTTRYLLKLQAKARKENKPALNIPAYSFIWLENILNNSVGIMTHRPKSIKKTPSELALYQILCLTAFFLFARNWRMRTAGFMLNQSIALVVSYALVLLLFQYKSYLWTLSPNLAVQGRYIFPVLVPLYGVAAYYLTGTLRARFALPLIMCVSAFYIWGDFPYFLTHTTPAWFA